MTLILAAAACGTDPDEPVAEPDPADPDPDVADDLPFDTLIVDQASINRSADVHNETSVEGRMQFRLTYQTLLKFEADDITEPVPWLAESMEVNDDNTEFTFTLRQDAVFSDGSPVTAEDVVFSLNRLKHLAGPAAWLMEGVTPEEIDSSTVVLRTDEPMPELPMLIPNPALGIANAAVLREHGASADEDAAETDEAGAFFESDSAGSGPYVITRWEDDQEMILERNENYWADDAPPFQRIVFRATDPATQRLAIQTGETHIAIDVVPDDVAGIDPSGLEILLEPGFILWYLQSTASTDVHPIAGQPDFWEGVRYAIDYEGILEIGGEDAVQVCGLMPFQVMGALPDEDCVERDLDRARAAFERAGATGDHEPIEMEYGTDLALDGLSVVPVAERLQANLAEAGVNVTLRPALMATALDRWRDGQSDMGLWSVSMRHPDPSSYLVLAPGGASGLRANWEADMAPHIADLAEQARTETDPDRREELFQEWQRAMLEESPIFPLMQIARAIIHDERLTGIQAHGLYRIDMYAVDFR